MSWYESLVGKTNFRHSYGGEPPSQVTKRETRQTLLQGVIKAFRLKPTHIARVADRLAAENGIPSISRNHIMRLSNGEASATEERIFILVAAISEMTGRVFRAADLFRLEPAMAGGMPGAVADGSSVYVPLSSGGNRLSRIWRIFVPQDTGLPPEESFERLYCEYGVLLRKIVMRRYGIPPDDAEALVHETFLKYLQRHTYIHEVKGYLYATTMHGCVDYWRARKREVPLLPEHDEAVDDRSRATFDALERDLTLSAVLARLGDKCRETLRGFFFRGERQDALADRLATTPGYIDQLISTCRRRAMELFRSMTTRSR